MSFLTRPLARTPTPLATVIVAGCLGAASAAMQVAAASVTASAPRVPALAVTFGVATAAIVLAASGVLWGSRHATRQHVRVGVASALCLAGQAVDGRYFELFRRHVDESSVRLGLEAVRTRTLHLGVADVLAGIAALGVVALTVALAHAELSRIPCGPTVDGRLRSAGALIVLLGLVGALLRERLWDERHDAAGRLAARLPWAPNERSRSSHTVDGWGTTYDLRAVLELGKLRTSLEQAPLSARERPDLLVVHVESLRADVMTEALMPRLSALAGECWTARRHYSTGNNTGMSVFGLVSGLSGFFYAGVRKDPAPALPLVVLKRLGYRSSVHFANNLARYDGVFEILFKGAVGDPYTAPDGPSDRMDVAVVEHYLASLDAGEGPRFDYVVLDSTHYDYAYPPEYERHTPSGTLGLGARDAVIVEPGINRRLAPKGPLVKNRYLNAVEWVDSLIGRIVDGLHARGRWGKTWVAFVGDHGEAFWEHGTFGHGGGLEDEQVRVPLVLCGSPRKSAKNEYSSHADLMPTWLDLMGLTGSPAPFMTGRSLVKYQPEADVAVAGMGVTGNFSSRRFVAAGRGLKVAFDDAPGLPIVSVADGDDHALSAVPDGAFTVLTMALGTKLFRSPVGE